MRKERFQVTNEIGLHARPASEFVATSGKFQSDVQLTYNDKTVDGKSIMGVMSLGIGKGETIEITVDGPDEDAAMAAIGALFAPVQS